MKNRHVTRFGNPYSPGGALYYVSDQEGLCQMAVDLEMFSLHRDGVLITSQLKSQIENDIRFERDIYYSKIAQHGVPNNVLELFQISTKSEATKYCKNLRISEFDLYLLIQNCYQIGFIHKAKFPDFVPNHLIITDDDRKRLKSGNTIPVTKKLGPLLDERRHINVHMFFQNLEWHCFYFSYEDIEPQENNHWKFGSHLHYVSYLWPKYTREQIWDAFDTRKTQISGNFHIRFSPYEYPEFANRQGRPPLSNKETPGSFAFDLALTSDCDSYPVPAANIATRGCWIIKVSTYE